MSASVLRFTFAVALVFSFVCSCPAQTKAAQQDDPLLTALQQELARSKAGLRLDGVQSPYFIQYTIADLDSYIVDSAFGALRSQQRAGARTARVVVRVGDYKQDSYYKQGEGTVEIVAREDNIAVLRQQLWWATDQAYKKAAEALSAKQALLKQYEVQQAPDDFSKQEPVTVVEPLRELDLANRDWPVVLNTISALYRQDPETQSFEAIARFVRVNEYVINTEGTLTRSGYATYNLRIIGSTQAPDGMRLNASRAYVHSDASELPADDKLRSDAAELLAELKSLRSAPLVEDEYRGPVLLGDRATARAMSVVVAENLLGRRPNPGVPSRTVGAYANSYKSPVFPESISILDDPSQERFGGRRMVGHYTVDSEGVRPAAVQVIDKGILSNYLMARHPIRDFPVSNGHGRAGLTGAPAPMAGNLIMSSSRTSPPAELKKQLIELCRTRGLPYGYYVEAFGTRPLAPELLYKVWADTGREELVRGAEIAELDARAMRTGIVGVGTDFTLHNGPDPVPHSMVVPSLLMEELVVKRTAATKDKLPSYAPPALSVAK